MKKLKEYDKELKKPKAKLVTASIFATFWGVTWLAYVAVLWALLSGAKEFITDNYHLYIAVIATMVLLYMSFNVIPGWFFQDINDIKENYRKIK